MSARRVAALLAAGLALVAFAMWIASRRHLERAALAGDLVLPGLEHNVNAVTEVGVRKGDGTRTTLKRDSAGWSVGERGWPADPGKVRKLLLDLGALNIVEEKTRLPANYPQLGVQDVSSPTATGARIEVITPARTWALIVGKSSGAKSGYVRVASAPQTLLAAPLLTVDADPKGWLDHALIDIAPERVRQVEERPTEGAGFNATRDKKEQTDFTVTPLPKGRELTGPGAADGIAGSLSSLTLDDVGKASAAAAAAHALFRTFDGLEVDVAGRKDGARSLVTVSARATAKQSEAEAQTRNAHLGGWEFEIPDYKYAAIFRPLEDLLKKPPAPVKNSTTASAPEKASVPGKDASPD
ncbi:MAG TPA: DUF4340 domain-containing protein, partial [Steroidobacteraceae bacterium]|nr:DUF4340 domain-containing protein [Steroidobacteraceae bacterium]